MANMKWRETIRTRSGAIATMAAKPPRPKKKVPIMVRLIGVGLFFGFGILGLLLVYSAFLFFGIDQFGIHKYFPNFVVAKSLREPASPKPAKPNGDKSAGSTGLGVPHPGDKSASGNAPGVNHSQPGGLATQTTGTAAPLTNPFGMTAKPDTPDLSKEDPTKLGGLGTAEKPPDLNIPEVELGGKKPTDATPPKAPENKTLENKTPDKKTAENKTAENKTAENKTVENKTPGDETGVKATVASTHEGKSQEKRKQEPGGAKPPLAGPEEKPAVKPAANAEAHAANAIEPKSSATFTSSELAAAVEAAHQSGNLLAEVVRSGGNASDLKSARRGNYMAMTHLATTLSHVKADNPAAVKQVARLKEEVSSMLSGPAPRPPPPNETSSANWPVSGSSMPSEKKTAFSPPER